MLAVVTAVIDARGADHTVSAHTLAAYRPALGVITGVAVLGLAVTLAGLRSARLRPVPAAQGPQASAGFRAVGSGGLPPGRRSAPPGQRKELEAARRGR